MGCQEKIFPQTPADGLTDDGRDFHLRRRGGTSLLGALGVMFALVALAVVYAVILEVLGLPS